MKCILVTICAVKKKFSPSYPCPIIFPLTFCFCTFSGSYFSTKSFLIGSYFSTKSFLIAISIACQQSLSTQTPTPKNNNIENYNMII